MKQKPLFTASLQLHYGIADADQLEHAWAQASPTIRGAGDVAARDWATLNGIGPVRPLPPELQVETMTPKGFNNLACLLHLQTGSGRYKAAKLVLVDGYGVGDAARVAGIKYTDAHKAVSSAREVIALCKIVVDSVRDCAYS